MRVYLLPLVVLAGCAQILGIEDPAPAEDECSPFDVTTCDVSDTCDLDEGGQFLTCRPEGGAQLGEICLPPDLTCAGGLTCYGNVCRSLCDDSHGCNTGEFGCIVDLLPETRACDTDCNVLTGDCATGEQECVPLDMAGGVATLCVMNGYFGDVGEGESCSFLGNCGRGLGCDVNGDGLCHPLCDVNAPACATGTCTHVGLVHESLDLGVCRP